MKRIENNQYILGSKFEIINIYYLSGEIESLEIQYFSKLDNLPSNKIFVREAAHFQNTGLNTNVICNCKYNCNNNKCSCKKKESNYRSRCYDDHSCQNKYDN